MSLNSQQLGSTGHVLAVKVGQCEAAGCGVSCIGTHCSRHKGQAHVAAAKRMGLEIARRRREFEAARRRPKNFAQAQAVGAPLKLSRRAA